MPKIALGKTLRLTAEDQLSTRNHKVRRTGTYCLPIQGNDRHFQDRVLDGCLRQDPNPSYVEINVSKAGLLLFAPLRDVVGDQKRFHERDFDTLDFIVLVSNIEEVFSEVELLVPQIVHRYLKILVSEGRQYQIVLDLPRSIGSLTYLEPDA